MTVEAARRPGAYLGERVLRNEDTRLLSGRGNYVDDIHLPGMLHGAVLRSPHAHARLLAIDTARARALPGVHAVYTYADLPENCRERMPVLVGHPSLKNACTTYALCRDEVNMVGDPVAFVVAADRYIAEDALDLIEVTYEPLPVQAAFERGLDEGAPLVHHDLGSNLSAAYTQHVGDVEKAIGAAPHVFHEKLYHDRGSAQPLETRGIVAQWDPRMGQLTCWVSTQGPIPLRNGLAKIFGLHEQRVRVIAPDVGGGFGVKIVIYYPEEILVPMAAMQLGRPVKWVEDRREAFISCTHERIQVHEATIAVDREGRILAVKDTFLHEEGAYTPYGPIVPVVASTTMPGPYKIPNFYVSFRSVFTNKQPVSPYRGAGRPHGVWVMERLLDRVARELGIDPAEVRRRNFIQPEEFPYLVGLEYQDLAPVRYDSGNYPAVLEMALEAIGYAAFRAREKAEARRQGRYLGAGLGCYVEGSGIGPYEGAKVQVGATGRVLVATSVGTQGQSHYTTLAQVAAEVLGCRVEDVEVVTGDTGVFPWGTGTFASRAAVVSGNAVYRAAQAVRQKACRVAAEALGVSPDDIEVGDGHAYVRGDPTRRLTLGKVADLAAPVRFAIRDENFEPGLEATRYYNPPQGTFANGVHAGIVEVDPETCMARFVKYVVVHDCGRVFNPMVMDGQIQGGLAQGIGASFYEKLIYDENGQLLTASYMDYLLPTAAEVPAAIILHHESPSPLNPLGAKGAGEGGVIPVAQVFAMALEDALSEFGIKVTEAPLSPDRLHRLIREALGR